MVGDLPRRTAHALHALLAASADLHMPPTAAEVCIYDAEALSPRATAAALRSAARDGWCACAGGVWVAGQRAHAVATELEDRFLAETSSDASGEGGSRP